MDFAKDLAELHIAGNRLSVMFHYDIRLMAHSFSKIGFISLVQLVPVKPWGIVIFKIDNAIVVILHCDYMITRF